MSQVAATGTNIVLIGMPGAGKSTVGRMLAAAGRLAFVDTDDLIEATAGCSLQALVDNRGQAALRALEEWVLLNLDTRASVIATGGSAVYSEAAMRHLQQLGPVVYLRVLLPELTARIDNEHARGLAREPGQTLADLYREREPLYRRYATHTIDASHRSPVQVCTAIQERLDEARKSAE